MSNEVYQAATFVGQAIRVIDCMNVDEMRQLHSILADRINNHIRHEQRMAACKFMEGEKVWWQSTKYGKRVEGVITKVCQKNIKVKATDGMNWTVSATFLNKVV